MIPSRFKLSSTNSSLSENVTAFIHEVKWLAYWVCRIGYLNATFPEDTIESLEVFDRELSLISVFFDWIPLTEEQEVLIHGNKGTDVGIIAQQIEKVLPEVVTTRDNGYKAVNYEKIVALLIEAIKEQQSEIDQLKDKINE